MHFNKNSVLTNNFMVLLLFEVKFSNWMTISSFIILNVFYFIGASATINQQRIE